MAARLTTTTTTCHAFTLGLDTAVARHSPQQQHAFSHEVDCPGLGPPGREPGLQAPQAAGNRFHSQVLQPRFKDIELSYVRNGDIELP